MLDPILHQGKGRARQSRAARRFWSKKIRAKLICRQEPWIKFRGDFEQRSEQTEISGAAVMVIAEILHGASPINIGQQSRVAEAHTTQRFRRAQIQSFLRN